MLLELLLKSLYFFLPAYLANMTPNLVRKIPFLGKPIWEAKLGSHKTWRGLVAGTLMGGIVFLLQQVAYAYGFTSIALIDYTGFSPLFGFFMGFGALFGDIIKSYYKRKVQIAPGQSWIPWDQLDFIFGGIIIGWLFYVPSIEVVVVLLIVSPFLHLAANYVGYLLHINPNRW